MHYVYNKQYFFEVNLVFDNMLLLAFNDITLH